MALKIALPFGTDKVKSETAMLDLRKNRIIVTNDLPNFVEFLIDT